MNLLDSLVRRRERRGPGKSEAVALEVHTHAMLGGRTGTPHWGMKGSPYEGGANTMLAASPQRFQGAAQLGASHNTSVQDYAALPSAGPPPAVRTWIQDWTHLEGVVPT